jgi:hypothetical protein
MREALRDTTCGSLVRRRKLAALLGLLVLAIYPAHMLFRSPCVGVADNGDFFRVTEPAGIQPFDAPRSLGRYVECEYRVGAADFIHFFSSAALAAWAATHLAWDTPQRMDLRQMGFTWFSLLLVVLAMFAASDLSALFTFAVFVVLLDPGYLLFLNSFYADPACLIPLAGCALWLRRSGPRRREFSETPLRSSAPWLCLLVALALCAGFSKMQYALFPGVLLVGMLPLLARRGPGGVHRLAVGAALAALAVAGVWHFSIGSGPRFLEVNNYHAVFAGIALVSSEPDRALDKLGIPADLRDLPRRDVWSARIAPDHPIHPYLQHLSRMRLALLYLRDPRAVVRTLVRIQNELALPRTHTRGNFPYDAEHPRKEVIDPFWRFGRVRSVLFGRWPWMLWLFLTAVAVSLGVLAKTRRMPAGSVAPYVFLVAWFLTQLVVVILGDGFVALEQHLLAARFALDLLLAMTGVEVCLGLCSQAYLHMTEDFVGEVTRRQLNHFGDLITEVAQ